MARFNKKVTPAPPVVNHQGGIGKKFSKELELVSLLSDGLDGRYYEKASDKEKRLVSLVQEVGKKDPEFVAKALVYARSVMGQRSVTHVGSVAAAKTLSGHPIASRFYGKRNRKLNKGGIVYRLDDMLEMAAYYFMRNPGKNLPNAMKRGFRAALESADSYEIAKYQGKGKSVTMRDVMRLVHPKPSAKMEDTFKALREGTLKQRDTFEDKHSSAGEAVAKKVRSGELTKTEAKVELQKAKAENWKDLIKDGSIGYLALLRNLRNIVKDTDMPTFRKALVLLTDEGRIRKSLVFPHQIDLAFEVLLLEETVPPTRKTELLTAVNKAYELAIPNLTELFSHGKTAVVFDTSGSMQGGWTSMYIGKRTVNSAPVEKAALIAATLAKGIGADMYHFASRCKQITYNPLDTVNTIKNTGTRLIGNVGHGTSFSSIFTELKGKYDRIFIISDMQGGDSILHGSSYQSYIQRHGQPFIYSVNLNGYGTTMFNQTSKLINLFGYSSDIYEMIKKAEIDPRQILKEIRAIEI